MKLITLSGAEEDYDGDASVYEMKPGFCSPGLPMNVKFALPDASEEDVAISAGKSTIVEKIS